MISRHPSPSCFYHSRSTKNDGGMQQTCVERWSLVVMCLFLVKMYINIIVNVKLMKIALL